MSGPPKNRTIRIARTDLFPERIRTFLNSAAARFRDQSVYASDGPNIGCFTPVHWWVGDGYRGSGSGRHGRGRIAPVQIFGRQTGFVLWPKCRVGRRYRCWRVDPIGSNSALWTSIKMVARPD